MGDNQLLLSVVIPIAAAPGKLERMKTWIENVNFDVCEVIMVHDVRNEGTQKELEEFVTATNHRNLKLLKGIWANPGGPRNEGIARSLGNWITFWDCDDTPNVINVLECLSKNIDADVHVGGFQVLDANSEAIITTYSSTKIEDLYINPGLWRIIFKKEVIGKTVFPERLMGEDQNFLMRLNIASMTVNFHKDIFYNYYVGNSGQLTSQARAINDLRFSILETFDFFMAADLAEREFVGIMLVKQYLSFIKRKPLIGIFKPSFLILKAFRVNPDIILKSFFKVFKSKGGE
jgi:hypothetical protein